MQPWKPWNFSKTYVCILTDHIALMTSKAWGHMCTRAEAGKGHFCFNMVSLNNARHVPCVSGSVSVHEYFYEKHMHVERLNQRER